MAPREELGGSNTRPELLRKAIDLVQKHFDPKKFSNAEPGQMILIDVSSGLNVVGNGREAVDELLTLRLQSGFPISVHAEKSFVFLPLDLQQIQVMSGRVGVVRDVIKKVIDPSAAAHLGDLKKLLDEKNKQKPRTG